MVKCEVCGCRCDNSDLVNGVCDDCREEEQKEQERHHKMSRMLNATTRQMELQEFLT